ncbi:hypothetical protein D3C81_1226730 [compost metagenome]
MITLVRSSPVEAHVGSVLSLGRVEPGGLQARALARRSGVAPSLAAIGVDHLHVERAHIAHVVAIGGAGRCRPQRFAGRLPGQIAVVGDFPIVGGVDVLGVGEQVQPFERLHVQLHVETPGGVVAGLDQILRHAGPRRHDKADRLLSVIVVLEGRDVEAGLGAQIAFQPDLEILYVFVVKARGDLDAVEAAGLVALGVGEEDHRVVGQVIVSDEARAQVRPRIRQLAGHAFLNRHAVLARHAGQAGQVENIVRVQIAEGRTHVVAEHEVDHRIIEHSVQIGGDAATV